MKKIFRLAYTILLCIFVCTTYTGMPQLSPAELQQMELLEKQLMQEIDQYVSSLSPEEQAEFQRAVEEETRKIESMKPEELNKYIQDTFSGVEQQTTVKKEELKVEVKKEPVKKPTEAVSQKEQQILTLIDSLTKSTGNYLRKISALPELTVKLPKWARQGRINYWPQNDTLEMVKKNIESFYQQLHKIITRDQKTNKYIFLNDIISNEALINNLNKLNSTLTHWEPQIVLRTLEFETLKPASKKAIIQATNGMLEGLHILAIPKALDDVIVKYDPEAKKLKEEAEKAQKKALEDSKKGIRPAAARSFGSEPTPASIRPQYNDNMYGGYNAAPQYRGGSNRSYTPQRSRHQGQKDNSFNTAQSPQRSSTSRGGGSYAASGSPRYAQQADRGVPMMPQSDMSKKKTDKDVKKTAATKPAIPDQAKRRIKLFGTAFEGALTKLTNASLIKPLATIMAPNIKAENIAQGNKALESLEEALGTIYRLAQGASAQQKKTYGNMLNAIVLENQEVLKELISQMIAIQKDEAQLDANHQYAYLGGKQENDASATIKKNIDKPFNLYKIRDLLEKIGKSIDTLMSGNVLPT